MSNKPSFLAVDYRIRTNKSTERRMLADAFRRLSTFGQLEDYRYVGFGSTTFVDFRNRSRGRTKSWGGLLVPIGAHGVG